MIFILLPARFQIFLLSTMNHSNQPIILINKVNIKAFSKPYNKPIVAVKSRPISPNVIYRRNLMRTIIALSFIACIALMPNYSLASSHGKTSMADKTLSTIKENPGASEALQLVVWLLHFSRQPHLFVGEHFWPAWALIKLTNNLIAMS